MKNMNKERTMIMKLQDLEAFTPRDVAASLDRNDPDELQLVSITVALSFPDVSFAQDLCLRLCSHKHRNVRGNAVMSLGYLARRFRSLDESCVRPAVESALHDGDEHVRALAAAAADEIHQFLHWRIAGHEYGSTS
jgi:hypothetical protein